MAAGRRRAGFSHGAERSRRCQRWHDLCQRRLCANSVGRQRRVRRDQAVFAQRAPERRRNRDLGQRKILCNAAGLAGTGNHARHGRVRQRELQRRRTDVHAELRAYLLQAPDPMQHVGTGLLLLVMRASS